MWYESFVLRHVIGDRIPGRPVFHKNVTVGRAAGFPVERAGGDPDARTGSLAPEETGAADATEPPLRRGTGAVDLNGISSGGDLEAIGAVGGVSREGGAV